jgi:hemolysin activation/secretion protein
MSRSLQRINKNPDREVRATLHAGKKSRTTDVTLTANTYFPVHSLFTFDREGTVSTGRARYGYGVRHNNFLTLDDTLITGYTTTKMSDNVYAYHAIPITQSGMSMVYGFTKSEASPLKDFESYDLRSYSKSGSIFFYQDIFNKDKNMGDISFGIDGNDKDVYTNEGLLNRDRLRVMRMSTSLVIPAFGGTNYIRPEYSQGLKMFGARSGEQASRGAHDDFSKFKLDLSHRKRLPAGMQLNLKSTLQYAGEKLAPQEEFSMGGIDSVRGYPFGDYYADSAVQTNIELLIPAIFLPKEIKLPYAKSPLRDSIQGIVFFDYAYGYRRGSREGEKTFDRMASLGAGIRIRLYDQVYLRVEWGVPLSMADAPISESTDVRCHISLNFEDQIDREWQRISKLIKDNKVVEAKN